MDERTLGLILRTRPLTETSLIVHWLTRDAGRISTVAKGARRPKSPFAGKLDLFYLADLTVQRSRCSDLHTLREVSVQDFHPKLRERFGYLQQCAYFTRLIEQSTEAETPIPGVFQLVREAIDALQLREPAALNVFAFEMKLLTELGLGPNIADSRISPGAVEILAKCASAPWSTLHWLKLSLPQTHEIGRFLEHCIEAHSGKVPEGRRAALAC